MFEASGRHAGARNAVFFAGAGLEWFRFFGQAFPDFNRTAIKFRPAAVRINRRVLGLKALEFGFDVRYFNNGFDPVEDFGAPSGIAQRGGEWVMGTFVHTVFR